MWSVGISPNDDYILRPTPVEITDTVPLEMRDGYMYYSGQKSDQSFLAAGVRYSHIFLMVLAKLVI